MPDPAVLERPDFSAPAAPTKRPDFTAAERPDFSAAPQSIYTPQPVDEPSGPDVSGVDPQDPLGIDPMHLRQIKLPEGRMSPKPSIGRAIGDVLTGKDARPDDSFLTKTLRGLVSPVVTPLATTRTLIERQNDPNDPMYEHPGPEIAAGAIRSGGAAAMPFLVGPVGQVGWSAAGATDAGGKALGALSEAGSRGVGRRSVPVARPRGGGELPHGTR